MQYFHHSNKGMLTLFRLVTIVHWLFYCNTMINAEELNFEVVTELSFPPENSNARFGSDGTMKLWDNILIFSGRVDDFGASTGAVYIYREQTWGLYEEVDRLTSPDAAGGDLFGSKVAIQYHRFFATAINWDDISFSNRGTCYTVQEVSHDNWQFVGSGMTGFDATILAQGDRLGFGLECDNEYVYILMERASGIDDVCIYKETSLFANDHSEVVCVNSGLTDDNFGALIRRGTSGGYFVVAASRDDEQAGNGGAIYVFEHTSDPLVYTRNKMLVPYIPNDNAYYGERVEVDDDIVYVSSLLIDGGGKVFIYQNHTGLGFDLIHTFDNPTPSLSTGFGVDLEVRGKILVINSAGSSSLHAILRVYYRIHNDDYTQWDLTHEITSTTLNQGDGFDVIMSKSAIMWGAYAVPVGSYTVHGIISTMIYNITNYCDDPTAHCFGNTECVEAYFAPKCTCLAGWTGSIDCLEDIDDCVSSPCMYGTCVDAGANAFTCACDDGFTGDLCETEIDECVSSPCENDGTCTDVVADFICTCTLGWEGDMCESDVDDCASSPCASTGVCIDLGSKVYNCTCDAGVTGVHCESDIDDCASSPCATGSTCIDDGINAFVCVCPYPFTGSLCDERVSRCLSSPCENGGTCDTDSESCICTDGYTGSVCETITDTVVSSSSSSSSEGISSSSSSSSILVSSSSTSSNSSSSTTSKVSSSSSSMLMNMTILRIPLSLTDEELALFFSDTSENDYILELQRLLADSVGQSSSEDFEFIITIEDGDIVIQYSIQYSGVYTDSFAQQVTDAVENDTVERKRAAGIGVYEDEPTTRTKEKDTTVLMIMIIGIAVLVLGIMGFFINRNQNNNNNKSVMHMPT